MSAPAWSSRPSTCRFATFSHLLGLFLVLPLLSPVTRADSCPKRGLVFVPNSDHPEDNRIWIPSESSCLTWYYNYQARPSISYSSISQEEFEFVPMFWGAPADASSDTTFYSAVKEVIEEGGRNVTHVLGFNEPDGQEQHGGSNDDPKLAAAAWAANMEPLKREFPWIRLGLPACTAAWGWVDWLREFLDECAEIEHAGERNCSFDFLPLHWYDNFEGLASHMGTARQFFPGVPLWITEYAYANQDLEATQNFYRQSADYLDRLDFVERYSYFGAFRSAVSNVGPNAVFLNNAGELTDIGSWYLGGSATGIDPQSGGDRSTRLGLGWGSLIVVTGAVVMVVI